ncbi:response regulator [Paraflavisolibacter sp. H34]|uniref:response regulator n=1 Tax=Huijunlia imazamoxiresistens TaxID=3127457 RepID=UPI00301635C0
MPSVSHLPRVDAPAGPSILLVDDDADDRCLFREALATAAPLASLHCLCDGEELLETIEGTGPALIFIDYNLPREDGIEYVRRLKAHPLYNNIPVIMWSGSSMAKHVAAAYGAGVQLFFEKPWEIERLIQKLKHIILHQARSA